MRAAVIHGPGDVRVEDVADPVVRRPTDAVVRVVAACVCGSDLWPWRGVMATSRPRRIGHEFVGVVEDVGAAVSTLRPGDFVVAPFVVSCGECVHCRNGVHTSCVRGAGWGGRDSDRLPVDAGQGERVRVPLADGTLVATPDPPDDALVPALLALSDVMGTGHHAALAAHVGPGSTVAVVGDGAVGLCGVLAARRLGAERVVVMSRHADRQRIARAFGAADVVEERGDEGVARLHDLLGGIGADSVLECVGTEQSMAQALASARPGGHVGYVGMPFGANLPIDKLFRSNVSVGGGVAPVRAYLPELMAGVLDGSLDPAPVFDLEVRLEDVAEGYRAMDERRSVKALVRP